MIRLAVRCPAEKAELVLAGLVDLAPAGVEQTDLGATTEYAIYGAPGEIPDLGDQAAFVNGIRVEVHSSEVGDDWAERWKEFHRPVEIAGRVRVRPPWETPGSSVEDIVIDPGRAFGTAAHPTTRMCAELLIDAADQGRASGPFADYGTGSGVLSIIAARLGWEPITAIDHERDAIEAATGNAAANGVELGLRRHDLRASAPPWAPTIAANLTADLLLVVAEHLSVAARPADRLICSGLLPEQAGAVEQAFWAARMTARRRLEDAGWAAIAFDRT